MKTARIETLIPWLAFACVGLLLATSHAMGAETRSKNLVSIEWLQQNMAREEVLLIDASGTRAYAAKHIPGAVGVDLYSYGPPFKSSPQAMEGRIQSWGVSPGRKIVIYDEGASNMATWLFYELYYHGYPLEDLFIVDGGLAKWEATGGAVTKERTPAPAKGTYRIAKVRDEVRVALPQFLAASGDRAHYAVVDALEAPFHYGDMKFFDKAGHVPNALLMPVSDFFNPDKTFKSPEEIRKMAAFLGIKPEQQIHSHCGGGVAATVPFFGLKVLAGYADVKVYKESQFEWVQDERELPLWTYDAPAIKRAPGWLNSWNNKMMRMYGVTPMSIVDVRSPDAFQLNHMPYALNVPADVFRANLRSVDNLAAILGPAGVDPSLEAVIVSDGIVNEKSALAFVMLEKLGHKKISILMGSVDDWGLQGFPLTKEPTIVGAPKAPTDLAVKPASYPANPRPGVLVPDAGASGSAYTKVFLASGSKLPARSVDGKVVHVPYVQLLNADGTPKPANEIWKVLAKAGVPRYAELICYSDEPGEAAANYYLLKLMGFPDVKVLL